MEWSDPIRVDITALALGIGILSGMLYRVAMWAERRSKNSKGLMLVAHVCSMLSALTILLAGALLVADYGGIF